MGRLSFKLSQSTYHFSVKPLASFLLVVTLKTLTIFGPALLYKALPTMGVAFIALSRARMYSI